jgi:hypothetical protein
MLQSPKSLFLALLLATTLVGVLWYWLRQQASWQTEPQLPPSLQAESPSGTPAGPSKTFEPPRPSLLDRLGPSRLKILGPKEYLVPDRQMQGGLVIEIDGQRIGALHHEVVYTLCPDRLTRDVCLVLPSGHRIEASERLKRILPKGWEMNPYLTGERFWNPRQGFKPNPEATGP